MNKTPLILALAASAAIGALPTLAAAQSYGAQQGYDQPTYQQQQDAYQQRLRDYNEQRAKYDWQREHPGRNYDNRDNYNNRGYDQRDQYASRDIAPCRARSNNNNSAASGLFGALAGAAIGSSLAGRGSHTEGAVLGAVAGGAIGASVGSSSARCDNDGYYYSYNQTVRYREPSDYNGQSSGRYNYDHYQRGGCRLVIAPVQYNGEEQTRYARVCPDGNGRYRLTE